MLCCSVGNKSLAKWNFSEYETLQLGAASIADYLRLTGAMKLPLEFEPGSAYHYSNPGYSLAGYIVEKVNQAMKHTYSALAVTAWLCF
jgi:CubicO group peptidase (beta-lactamase class C family)